MGGGTKKDLLLILDFSSTPNFSIAAAILAY